MKPLVFRYVGVGALVALLAAVSAAYVQTSDGPAAPASSVANMTPPRLSFVDQQVSFWRPGAEEWVAAQVNTALAAGDELYTGSPGNLEIQIGARAYVRAWGSTQLGVVSVEPDFFQLKVTTGYVSVDVRRLEPGHTIEVDTPNAAFTIEHAGYYRVNVAATRTSFITRRGGRATMTTASGRDEAITPSEEVVVEGDDGATTATYIAPELDAWDRWNYARTDALADAMSSRYVSPGIYGIDDLDHHGSWRVVETYGAVWVPRVPTGWVPYSTGSWIWDPWYGWTWVDTAPWGWAPYHYGRWVVVGGVWAWAPGPAVVRPVYAPALVAFLGPRVGVAIGPTVGWVALGWGEPIVPWWGHVGFIGVPWWAGWGGPRIVNTVVISHTTVVHAHEIHTHRNAGVRHAVVGVPRDRFGRGPVTPWRADLDPRHLEPIPGKPEVGPGRASLVADGARGVRPPEATLRRPVVATRPPDDPGRRLAAQGIVVPPTVTPPPRLVPAPSRRNGDAPRPPFGASKIERPRPPEPPRPDRVRPPSTGPTAPQASASKPSATRPAPAPATPAPSGRPSPPAATSTPSAPSTRLTPARPATPPVISTPAPRVEGPSARPPVTREPRQVTRPLPGEPANRLFPGGAVSPPARRPEPSARAAPTPTPHAPARPAPSPQGKSDGHR